MQTFTIKRDKFKKNRGEYSRFLNIYCDHCGEHILLYQKDGPGPLKRMYLDRIHAPTEIAVLQTTKNIKDIPNLICRKCKRPIGIPSVYEKENRKVYLLLSYSVIKKVGKGIYPPEFQRLEHLYL